MLETPEMPVNPEMPEIKLNLKLDTSASINTDKSNDDDSF